MTKQDFGIVGLGVMGENLALNIESRGFGVVGFDLDPSKVESFASRTAGKKASVAHCIEDFVAALATPRRILIMVPAGKAVDTVISNLRPLLSASDLLIDGGNTYFADTTRRIEELRGTGILYVGSGISGGEEGALRGPSIMPGGDPAAWPLIKPVLLAIAARAEDGAPCCEWIGPGGSGHFVKMVHNGIEYGDMQMICEAYYLMSEILGMSAPEMSRIFSEFNRGELNSYLVDITAKILDTPDSLAEGYLVDKILDTAEQKGTGKWASQVALDLGVAAPTIADAVFARTLSAIQPERVAASRVLSGPSHRAPVDSLDFVEKVRRALFASKICSYAQGFQLLRAADQSHGWGLNFGQIASLWRAGCIIRAQFLDRIKNAYQAQPALENLLLDGYFANIVNEYQSAWREVVAIAAARGVAVPAFMSALAYFDGYRAARLPANLLSAQRDYFGAHTYRRLDRPGIFHTKWTE